MADDTRLKYIVELLTQGDTKKATDELNKVHAASAKTNQGLSALSAGWGKLFALVGGTAVIHQSINEFLEQERAIAKLNAALKATGEFTPKLSEEMIKLAESMSQVSLFADDAILNVIAKLTAAGAKSKDIERLTKTVLDLATLMDRDLNRVTQVFSQALLGEVSALKSLGATLDETKTATEQFNDAQRQFAERAGGQALEAAKTLGGGFEQLKKNIGDVKKEIGGVILEAIDPMIEKLSRLAQLIANFSGTNRSSIARGFQTANKITGLASGLGLSSLITDIIGGSKPTHPMADLGPEAMATLQHFFSAGAAGSPASIASAAPVTTPGLEQKDWLAMGEQIKRIGEASAKSSRARADAEKETTDLLERQAGEILDDILRKEDEITEKELRQNEVMQLKKDITLEFAAGLSTAIVNAFEEGDKAFKKFASNFLKTVAQMIMQMLILQAIRGIAGAFSSGGSAPVGDFNMNPNVPMLAGSGGQWLAMAGGGMVSSPTLFPRFGVMAGEAGPEMLSVLSRPRFETINGVPMTVGNMGSRRMALGSADAMAHAAGQITLRVSMAPGLKAEIVASSVQGARLQVVQDLHDDTAISKGVKALTT